MNTDFLQDPAAGRYLDAHLGSTAARLRLDQLHSDAAARRLVRACEQSRPAAGVRPRLATLLRRIADRLAPVPRQTQPVTKPRVIGSH